MILFLGFIAGFCAAAGLEEDLPEGKAFFWVFSGIFLAAGAWSYVNS